MEDEETLNEDNVYFKSNGNELPDILNTMPADKINENNNVLSINPDKPKAVWKHINTDDLED